MGDTTCMLFFMMKLLESYEIAIYEEIRNRVIIELGNERLTKKEILYLVNKNSYCYIKNINNCVAYKKIIPNIVLDCKNNTLIRTGIFDFSNIRNLILPKQINNLSSFCFYFSKIKTINLENVSLINSSCFQDCRELEEITLPENLLQIDNFVFANCEKLRRVIFPKKSSTLSIKTGAFNNCIKLKKISLPDTINSLENQSFCNTGLTEFRYPKNISHIYNDILLGSNNIKSIKIPKKFFKINDRLKLLFNQQLTYY